MSAKTKIFFLGATGYIGGTFLQRLREHPTFHNLEVTALVRSMKKIPLLTSIGIKTVHGTLDNAALLEQQASGSDIVFACADNHHIRSYEAILRGLKKKHQRTGTVPVLFHTSEVVGDDAEGMYASNIIWDDMDLEQMKELMSSGSPYLADSLVLEADKQGYVRSHIVLLPPVYGFATGPLIDLGIQNSNSFELEDLIDVCLARKRAGMVGLGLNRWAHVHIDDLGDLYTTVYNAVLDGHVDHGLEGLYFAENGECSIREIAERIGEVFVKFGVSHPGEETPTPFDERDYARSGDPYLKEDLGMNSRCVGHRARMLGWEPRHTTEDMLEDIRNIVRWLIKQNARMC